MREEQNTKIPSAVHGIMQIYTNIQMLIYKYFLIYNIQMLHDLSCYFPLKCVSYCTEENWQHYLTDRNW